jgi:hypothetical protein
MKGKIHFYFSYIYTYVQLIFINIHRTQTKQHTNNIVKTTIHNDKK